MATKSAEKLKTYNVQVHLKVSVSKEIPATSLADAIAKANGLTISDFIDFEELGLEHDDSEILDVYGVYRNE